MAGYLADTLLQPDLVFDFQVELNQASGATITELVNFGTILNGITPPVGYTWAGTGIKAACRLVYLQAQYLLPSIKGIDPPELYPEDSDSVRISKIKEAEKNAPHKGLALYVDPQASGVWQQRAQTNLQNYGDTGTGRWSYLPLKTPFLGDDRALYHPASKIGASIVNTGSGTLGVADKVQLIGSVLIIPNWVIDLSTTAFANSTAFGVSVGPTTPVQVLAARANRKQLHVAVSGKCWFMFASSGAGVVKNQCSFLTASGALTYENGRLSFEGDRGEMSAINGTQGLALWCLSDTGTITVSGVEYY